MTVRLFVAGGHTDVGKTYVTCRLLEAARRRGLQVAALKPVITGFDPAEATESDTGRLLAAMGREVTAEAVAAVSPWRFDAPLAPPMAAAAEGRTLPFSPMAEAGRAWLAGGEADVAFVEGAGGIMSPIADAATCLDLMAALGLPALLVGGSYLGAISHTLTAQLATKARGVDLAAIVVSQSADPEAPDFTATLEQLTALAEGAPVVAVARNDPGPWADRLLDRLLCG